ncbi:restriction endonuclease [soil metagenome]
MLPLLQLASDGEEHVLREAGDAIAQRFRLSDEDRQELLPSGRQRRFTNRMAWASVHLRRAGLLTSSAKGRFHITEQGRAALAEHPSKINMAFLKQYPEYVDFIGGTAHPPTPQPDLPETPEEILEATYHGIKKALADDLLERVKAASPLFFEQLVVQLLVTMGYGGSQQQAGEAVGKSGDGGIDGIINEDPLGLDVVYIQAKRWQSTVGRPEIQMFAGSLDGQRATKGVFITTSTFSPDARGYVKGIAKKIVLIDGKQLADLMIQHNVGVTDVAVYALKKVDFDYFEVG